MCPQGKISTLLRSFLLSLHGWRNTLRAHASSVRRGLAPAEFVCFKDALRFIWRVYASEKKGNYVTADLPFKIERMERAPSVRRGLAPAEFICHKYAPSLRRGIAFRKRAMKSLRTYRSKLRGWSKTLRAHASSVRRGLAPAEFVCFKDALRFIWRGYASAKKGKDIAADLPFKIERMERAPSVRRGITFRKRAMKSLRTYRSKLRG